MIQQDLYIYMLNLTMLALMVNILNIDIFIHRLNTILYTIHLNHRLHLMLNVLYLLCLVKILLLGSLHLS